MRGIFPYAADLYARNHTGGFDQDIRVASSPTEVRVVWNTETFYGPGTTDYWNHTGSTWTPGGGTARGWKDDDAYWELPLPFAFPFWGEEHQKVFVGSNGYLTFGTGESTFTPNLSAMKGILAFAKDLRTDCSDTDIHTDVSASVVKIRWAARAYNGSCSGAKVNFEIDLYPGGLVKVGYGLIEDTAGDQVVGVSKGDGVHSVTSTKDHAVLLNSPPVGSGASPEDLYEPAGGWPVNVEAVLRPSGEIRFRYGEMQDRHDFGQVGVSRGDGVNYQAVAGYDGQQIPSGAQTVILTRQAAGSGPAISGYAASPSAVSPNGDGVKDSTTLSATWDRSATWSLAIQNGAGSTVRSSSGSGTSMAQSWDGKDGSGVVVPDGAYTAALTVTDIDGLASSAQVTVEVDGAGPTISGLATDPARFSPNGDGVKDQTTISATLSEASEWTLAIKSSSGSTVRSYSGSGTAVSQAWDGKNSSGSVVANGTYTATLTATDNAGNSSAASTTVVVDTVGPSITGYAASPTPFSPNGDGVKDETTFAATLSDPAAPIAWTLDLKTSAGTVVRSFSGQGSPLSQAWNGRDFAGAMVADGTYTGALRATDDAGNTASASVAAVAAVVDTTAPSITSLFVAPNPFSPNGNGVQDETTFRATISGGDTWALAIRNSAGDTVRSYSGGAISPTVVWDGKNASGSALPDGPYTGRLTATDTAGNPATSEVTVTLIATTGRVIEQHWELLSESTSFASDGTFTSGSSIPLKRGSLPSGAARFDPPPAASFEVVARVAGATGTARWTVTVVDSISARAQITLGAGDTTFGIKTAAFLWPNADVSVDTIQVQASKGSDPTSVTGTLELRKAYLKLAQDGVIKKTLGRVNLANREPAIASDSWSWPADRVIFKMPSSGAYNPAPEVRLRATAQAGPLGGSGLVRLFDATTNAAVAGSNLSFGSTTPESKETGALSLVAGREYELNVAVLSAGQTFDLLSADLVFEQSTADPNGLAKTVGYFTGVNAPTSWTSSGTDLGFLLNAPRGQATSLATRWFATVKYGQGSATVDPIRVDAFNRTAGTTYIQGGANATTSYRLVEGTTTPTTLPAAGEDLDTRGINGPSATGQVSGSLLRVDYELEDVAGPSASLLENPAYVSPNGDGVQDSTTLTASMSDPSPPIAWTIDVKTSGGTIVRRFSGEGTSASVVWDGRNSSGAVVPDGTYQAVLTATDSFSNQTVRARNLFVDTVAPVITDYVVAPNPFSPNGDGDRDTTTFSAGMTDETASAVGWSLLIKNASGSTVRSFSGTVGSGGGSISQVWDGRNTSGTTVGDGTYDGTLTASDFAGNAATASKPVTVDRTPPSVGSVVPSLPSFSPNGDGVKDATTFEAQISDVSPSVDWTLVLTAPDSATVRTFSGSGKNVSQAWDGKDAAGAVVPDGLYSALLTAVDPMGLKGSGTAQVSVDTVGPTASDWTPADGANTLWKRPDLGATLSDVSGIDAASVAMTLDGAPLAESYDAEVRRVSATPLADLALDQDHILAVAATDLAGNTGQPTALFRVIRVTQESLEASIPDVTAVVPPATECATGCTVTFEDVAVALGQHTLTLSSSGHAGAGEFARDADLTSTTVTWQSVAGTPIVTPANLSSARAADEVWLDDAWDVAFAMSFERDTISVGDVSVPVPAAAAPGSAAILRMQAIPVPPPCADSSVAADPATCGGPLTSAVDPLPDPEPEEDIVDIDLTRTAEEIVALEDAVSVPPLPATPDVPEPAPSFPSGDTSPTDFVAGLISVQVKPGEDISAVVADYGGSAADVATSFEGPFDEIDTGVGIDRYFDITVPVGLEKTRLVQYANDPRVEYAELEPLIDQEPSLGVMGDVYDDSVSQWNLLGDYGIHVRHAHRYADSTRAQTAVIDTPIRGDHQDLRGKMDRGYRFDTNQPIAENENTQPPTLLCDGMKHGTRVAGINANTGNGVDLAGVNNRGHLIPILRGDGCGNPYGSRHRWIGKAIKLGAEVINMSYGFKGKLKKECDAVLTAWRHGIVLVSGYRQEFPGLSQDLPWPGRCPNVLTTTANDERGKKPDWTLLDDHVEVVAPGEGITTLDGDSADDVVFNSRRGTSFAAPHVSGLAHLLKAMGASNYVALQTIWHSSTRLGWCDMGRCASGGRINAYRAVKSTQKNGTMERWSGGEPVDWKVSRKCQSTSTVSQTGTNVTYAGASGLATKCTGSKGFVEVYQKVPVSPGWRYRFRVAAAIHSSGQPNPNRLEVVLCLYKKGATKPYKCSKPRGDAAGITTSWKEWVVDIQTDGRAHSAKVGLRTLADTGGGTAYWDDVGFYAYRPPQ